MDRASLRALAVAKRPASDAVHSAAANEAMRISEDAGRLRSGSALERGALRRLRTKLAEWPTRSAAAGRARENRANVAAAGCKRRTIEEGAFRRNDPERASPSRAGCGSDDASGVDCGGWGWVGLVICGEADSRFLRVRST